MNDWPSLVDPQLAADPYPFYRRSHLEAPVRWDPEVFGVGSWFVTPHAMVSALLRDPRLSADRSFGYRGFMPDTDDGRLLGDTLAGSLAFKDPPDHTRLRALISKVFTPRAVETLRPRIEALVDALLPPADVGQFDVMARLASPLPVTVMCELLGIPVEDAPRLKPWIDDYAMFIGIVKGLKKALASMRQLHGYFEHLFAERRKTPRDDLLTSLLQVEEQGERLSSDELFHVVAFLFAAGQHTTTNLIGNGLLALLRQPDALAKLQAEPALMANAVEELLRYDSPVQFVGRVAKEDLELRGHAVQAGQLVNLMLGAANHDPDVFTVPGRVRPDRPNAAKHVSFAGGIHFCIGAPLARVEGAVAFGAILRRFPRIALAAEPAWVPNLNLRGLKGLLVNV